MPDLWYQGNISFADSLFQINATSGWRDMIVDILAVSGREIDVLKLSYDANFAAFFLLIKMITLFGCMKVTINHVYAISLKQLCF